MGKLRILGLFFILNFYLFREIGGGTCTNNECSSRQDPLNKCVAFGTGGAYICECNGNGWVSTNNQKGCAVSSQGKCTRSDWCSSNGNPKNQCINKDGGAHECVCNADGWKASDNKQSCIPPVNVCEVRLCVS